MTPSAHPQRLRGRGAALVLSMAGVFLLIGAAFIASPPLGAALFGLPATGAEAQAWLRALALRDLALGLYLAGLLWLGSRRSLGVVLAATVVIPPGDMLMVAGWHGGAAPAPLLLHGLSALATGGMAAWLLRPPSAGTPSG
ncbi:DUF4267 domain-containing protein [Teichococcus oryzae]|nr:DUF4267 domain-containing protein [Pseudoroseomonas oryzae]